MFGHYPFIAKQHVVALEAAVRNHTTVTGPLLASLYQAALTMLNDPGNITTEGMFTSKLITDNVVSSNVTDAKTGIWMQLAKVKGQSGNYLTLGQKWAMEQYVPAHGNVSTIFW